MDAIARALGRPLRTGSQLEPASTVVPLAAAASARRRRRVRVPLVPAGVVAAAAVVLALLLAGPAPLRLPSQTASNVRSRASGGREAAARPSSEASRAAASTPVSPSAAAISPSRAPQSTAAATPEASSPGTSTCPTGEVAAVVERVTQDVEQPPPTSVGTQVSAALPALMRTTVTGVLHNTARAAVTVDPFPVDITFTNSPGATSSRQGHHPHGFSRRGSGPSQRSSSGLSTGSGTSHNLPARHVRRLPATASTPATRPDWGRGGGVTRRWPPAVRARPRPRPSSPMLPGRAQASRLTPLVAVTG